MSYAYKIKLERLSGEVCEKGTWKPSLMEILSPAEMKELFRDALIEQGWKCSEPVEAVEAGTTKGTARKTASLSMEIEGIQCDFDEENCEIRAILVEEISVEQSVTADSDDNTVLKEARIQEGKRQQKQKLDTAKIDKARQLTAQLLSIESQVKAQIDLASHHAHAEALNIKAARLGDIQSTQSSVNAEGTLEVTIHVQMK